MGRQLELLNKFKLNQKGAAPVISVLVFTPILLGLVAMAYTSSATSQADQSISSAAANAAKAAVVCCRDAADAAVAAENTVRSSLQTNSIPCQNLTSSDENAPSFIKVEFIQNDPTATADDKKFVLLTSVTNPRSTTPADLRQKLGDSLSPGVLVRVTVNCELRFQNLTGLWLPFGASTTRIQSSTAIIDPFISQ